jgi:peroxiredoxin
MSHRVHEKERRRAERLAAEEAASRTGRRARLRNRLFWGASGALVVGLLVAAFALPKGGGSTTAAPAAMSHSGHATAVTAGSKAPDFAVTDAVSGRQMRLADLAGQRTLLFFSEGASCQACLVQAYKLQRSAALRRAGIKLVSITTDTADVLRQVATQYRIGTPLLADSSRSMSTAYGQLGRGGMGHPDMDGHSFVLVDEKGRVAWEKPYTEMFVPTDKLLADMKV